MFIILKIGILQGVGKTSNHRFHDGKAYIKFLMKDGLSPLNFKMYIHFDTVISLSGIDATDIYCL